MLIYTAHFPHKKFQSQEECTGIVEYTLWSSKFCANKNVLSSYTSINFWILKKRSYKSWCSILCKNSNFWRLVIYYRLCWWHIDSFLLSCCLQIPDQKYQMITFLDLLPIWTLLWGGGDLYASYCSLPLLLIYMLLVN